MIKLVAKILQDIKNASMENHSIVVQINHVSQRL